MRTNDHPEDIEPGDVITVLARETPMEVTSVEEGAISGWTVKAENHHGRYQLRYHGSEKWSLRAGGRLIDGGLEVEIQ